MIDISPRPPGLHRAAAALALLSWLAAAGTAAAPLEPDRDELRARAALAPLMPGARLLWVRGDRIMHSPMDRWDPQPALPGLAGRQSRPRWSPDGSRFLFDLDGAAVYVQDAAGGAPRRVLAGAHTADWASDGESFTAISLDGHQVLRHDLTRNDTRVLHDTRQPPFHGQVLAQAAELHPDGRYLLTFRREPRHSTEIVDLEQGRYLANPQMRRGDCNPAWTPDGRHVLTTARAANRPILYAPFDPATGAVGPSRHLAGLDSWSRYELHDARPSRDGAWLVAAGAILLGGAMAGRQEIYVWRRGDAADRLVRLTFDSADDTLPSLFVPPGQKPG